MPLTSKDWIENKGQKLEKGSYMLMYENGNVDTDRIFNCGKYNEDITHFIPLDPPPLPRWRPRDNEEYWLVNGCGQVEFTYWGDSHSHRERYAIGNCFPSQEAAEASEHYEFAQRMKAKYGGDQ